MCDRVCRCGADIVATDLQQDMCKDTVSAIKDLDRQVEFVPCDVRDRTSVDDVIKQVEK
jgi:NAD(P)-dependent dehydrogenase (short-subunit alcohol dehydrogenase family)